MLPAGGPEIPTFLSYNVEKQLSRNKDEFGRGAIEGVAGPEAANNAAFEIFNLQPGPLLFENLPDLVCGL
jgi:putative tricarboxylic transport membrane protein